MPLIVNCRFLSQQRTGVQSFALSCSLAIKELAPDTIFLAPKNIMPEFYDIAKMLGCKQIGSFKGHMWEQWSLPRAARRIAPDACIISFSGLIPLWSRKSILTIHDLSFLHEPKWFSRSYFLLYWIMTNLCVRHAIKVLTVSRFCIGELCKYFPFVSDRICLVYNACPEGQKFSCTKKNQILAVGSQNPRKNLKNTIHGFYASGISNWHLLIVGGNNRSFANTDDLSEEELSHVHFLGYISDEELAIHYAESKIVIYLSHYEGFGIPPLEALFHHCRLVLSDIPPFREIFDGCGILAPPENITAIAGAIRQSTLRQEVATDEDYQQKRIEILSRYSYENQKNQLRTVIRELL
jgi:glycosyltransferase involved in cell wall biosynthesis